MLEEHKVIAKDKVGLTRDRTVKIDHFSCNSHNPEEEMDGCQLLIS